MTLFSMYEEKQIRLTDDHGNTFTGIADTFPAEYGMRVHATGDNAFPEHYYDVMGAMWNILMQMTEA